MFLERMATWTREKLTEFFLFIADKSEKLAAWIGQKVPAWMKDFRAIFKDPATAFTVVKELTFGAVINAADVGTDIYTALSHYQLLVASDQMK